MKKYNLRTAISAQPALPALIGAACVGIADTADIAVRRCETEREVLDAVRLVFPNAKFVRREPPLDLVAKECLVSGRVYYGGSESQVLRKQMRFSRSSAVQESSPDSYSVVT